MPAADKAGPLHAPTTAIPPTARSRKGEQAERSRERLIEAATGLFAARGYRATSVQAIAEAAGISRGSIFWHFGSKEGLLWAVVERRFAAWESEVLLPDVGGAKGVEAIRRALSAHKTFLTERSSELRLFYVLLFEALGPRPDLASEFARLHLHIRELTTGWIQDAIDAGELRAGVDAEAVVIFITGALGGIAYQWLLNPGGFDLERVYSDLATTFERGLRAGGEGAS
jgi:TetR/AcrR family transcriptional regulator, acrAB operon repressor